jgi:hypothetical protein
LARKDFHSEAPSYRPMHQLGEHVPFNFVKALDKMESGEGSLHGI